MEAKELERMVASAELRSPKVFNASRERYVAEISFKAGMKKVVEWIEDYEFVTEAQGYCKFMLPQKAWQAKLEEWGLSP